MLTKESMLVLRNDKVQRSHHPCLKTRDWDVLRTLPLAANLDAGHSSIRFPRIIIFLPKQVEATWSCSYGCEDHFTDESDFHVN